MTQVLLIDDDVELAGMLADYLTQEGYAVAMAHDGESGANEALSGRHQIVVLDVMMPRLNGIEVLRQIRAQSAVPVLMLTARGDDTDRIIGLELGADDYVPKPCTPRELTARIRAILRRTQNTDPANTSLEPLIVGALTIRPEQRLAELEGETLSLTSTEFNLLEVLVRHAGRPVGKAMLSEQGLGRPLTRYDRSIDVHLSSIRHKLGNMADGRSYIQTVYRQGYQFLREG